MGTEQKLSDVLDGFEDERQSRPEVALEGGKGREKHLPGASGNTALPTP